MTPIDTSHRIAGFLVERYCEAVARYAIEHRMELVVFPFPFTITVEKPGLDGVCLCGAARYRVPREVLNRVLRASGQDWEFPHDTTVCANQGRFL